MSLDGASHVGGSARVSSAIILMLEGNRDMVTIPPKKSPVYPMRQNWLEKILRRNTSEQDGNGCVIDLINKLGNAVAIQAFRNKFVTFSFSV